MTLLGQSRWQGRAFSDGLIEPGGGRAAVIEPATRAEPDPIGLAAAAGIRAAATAAAGVAPSMPGTGARFGGSANLDAFTDTRWVTIRGDIAPYPF
jgi:hypothetical protein